MSIDLSTFARASAPPAILSVIFGPRGVGKTTMAANAPDSVILRVEDGVTNTMPCQVSPIIANYAQLVEVLTFMYQSDHGFKSLGIDSLDWLETNVIWPEVCARNEWADIEEPGYGKGYLAAAVVWNEVLAMLSALWREREMNIICLAHEKIEAFRPPDADPYDRYAMKLNARASSLIEEWAWVVGFLKYETHTTTVEKDKGFAKVEKHTRGVSAGNRVLYVQERPAWRAKNRYSLPPEVRIPSDEAQSWAALETAINGAQQK